MQRERKREKDNKKAFLQPQKGFFVSYLKPSPGRGGEFLLCRGNIHYYCGYMGNFHKEKRSYLVKTQKKEFVNKKPWKNH